MEAAVYRPLRNRPRLSMLIAAIGLSILLSSLMQAQALPGQVGDVAVALMRRVERAAEQANAHAPPVAEPPGGAQGRLAGGCVTGGCLTGGFGRCR